MNDARMMAFAVFSRLLLLFGLCGAPLVFALPGALRAQSNADIVRIYHINALPIEAQNADLVAAKTTALREAKLVALQGILRRITGKPEIRLPQPDELESMIASTQINDEIFGGNLYRARLNIVFKPEGVRGYLRRLNERFFEARAPSVLIVPMVSSLGLDRLWAAENFWFADWQAYADASEESVFQQVVPLRVIDWQDSQVVVDDFTAPYPDMSEVINSYQASEMYAVHLRLPEREMFDSRVSLAPVNADTQRNTAFERSLSVPVVLARISAGQDQAWRSEKTFDLAVIPVEGSSGLLLDTEPVMLWVHQQLNRRWTSKLIAESGLTGTVQSLYVRLMTFDIRDWQEVRQMLNATPVIKRFRAVAMQPTRVDVEMALFGSITALKRQLRNQGWELVAVPEIIGETSSDPKAQFALRRLESS